MVKINIKEFREEGFLQEANRLFFHPLGLALEVCIDENKNEYISGVWDYRNDPEGICYDLINSDQERIESFREKAENVDRELRKHIAPRTHLFKSDEYIEEIPEEDYTAQNIK